MTFQINYKSFFRESSEHHSELVKAKNCQHALAVFAERHRISNGFARKPEQWEWWDGEYLYQFRNLARVKKVPCSNCDGTGELLIGKHPVAS